MSEKTIKRDRSEFKVIIFKNDDGHTTIVTPSQKWASFISVSQEPLIALSPKGWRETAKGNYSLCIPEKNLDLNIFVEFEQWLDEVNSYVWLGLNKNIKGYFTDELDYCVAADWNFSFDTRERTEVGEAEYQIKYQYASGKIDKETAEPYAKVLIDAVTECSNYLPIVDRENLLITTIPSVKEDQKKLSWGMARYIHSQVGGSFLIGTLTKGKPQTKTLGVSEKINVWKSIYADKDNIELSQTVADKDIIIVDDLYQSGASMWAFAEFLKKQGCRKVIGLVAVKSLKDSDNS